MNKVSIFDEGKRTNSILLRIVFILSLLVLFLSAWAAHFVGLGYAFSFLLGSTGFVLIIPLLWFLNFSFIFKKKNKDSKRVIIGYLILVFGLSLLLIDLSFKGEESVTNISKFTAELDYSKVGEHGGFAFNVATSGGILCYLVAGFFTEIIGNIFTIVLSSLIIFVGILTTFAKTISNCFTFAKKKAVQFQKKKAQKARRKEEQEGFDLSSLSNSLLNTEIKAAPVLSTQETDDVVSETRYQRSQEERMARGESRESSFVTPRNLTSGLTPALFGFDDAPKSDIQEATIPEEIEASVPLIVTTLKEEVFVPQEETETEEQINEPEIEKEVKDEIESSQDEIVLEEMPSNDFEMHTESEEPAVEEPVPETSVQENENPGEPIEEGGLSLQPKAFALPPFTLPGSDLLNEVIPPDNLEEVEKACLENEAKINAKLESLGVGAYVSSHTIGPSVTRYNIKTNENVPISNVSRVIDDLSIKLGGVPIRFETLIKGSETSGLEVSNPITTMVYYRECFEALPKGEDKNMVFPFGKSIAGKVLYSDLSEFPHMLVSGTSGSGKSVFVHQILMSLIMRNRPEDLKLLLIDPKHIEMGKYREIGHLICPVVNDPIKAKVALEKIVQEMNRRYSVLDAAGGLSIREFNEEFAPENGLSKLPFIVVVIDEFADLVESCRNISELVLKIAQKARAAGIHIVLATQRPDVSVISGTIKANLQTRVALSMTSSTDSQTILGVSGAEDLNGNGDMLIECQQLNRVGLTRCQGSFVSKSEIKRVTDWIRNQYKVQYYPEFMDLSERAPEPLVPSAPSAPSAAEAKELSDEAAYQMVKEYIVTRDYASVSGIQREFGYGYPRAGKLLNRLAKEGIVAQENDPRNTAKGRFILNRVLPDTPVANGSVSQTTVIPEGFPQPEIKED